MAKRTALQAHRRLRRLGCSSDNAHERREPAKSCLPTVPRDFPGSGRCAPSEGWRVAHGVAPAATGDLLAVPIPTRASGGDSHQSDLAGLGELLCHWPLEPMLSTRQTLGGVKDPAPSAACPESSRVRVAGVDHGETVRRVWPVQRLLRPLGSALGTPQPSGLITLDEKRTRERSAVTPHAAFDVAGAGTWRASSRRRASPRPYRLRIITASRAAADRGPTFRPPAI